MEQISKIQRKSQSLLKHSLRTAERKKSLCPRCIAALW